MYYGDWDCREDILNDFGISSFDGVVIQAYYEYADYTGYAYVIYYHEGRFYYVADSHCSCNGLEDWDPEELTLEMILHMISNGRIWRAHGTDHLAEVVKKVAAFEGSPEELEDYIRSQS